MRAYERTQYTSRLLKSLRRRAAALKAGSKCSRTPVYAALSSRLSPCIASAGDLFNSLLEAAPRSARRRGAFGGGCVAARRLPAARRGAWWSAHDAGEGGGRFWDSALGGGCLAGFAGADVGGVAVEVERDGGFVLPGRAG